MERKLRGWLIVAVGIVLTTVSGTSFGAQLAINSFDPVLYGRHISSHLSGEIMDSYSDFNPSYEIVSWGAKKFGTDFLPTFNNQPQWGDASHDLANDPPYLKVRKIFQPHDNIWSRDWVAEEIFSAHNVLSSNDPKVEEEEDVSGLPPLPHALWLCGFGIVGILSVRRTSDHSNVT